MELPFLRLSRLLLLGQSLMLLWACSSTNVVNIEGSDSTRFTDLRASFPVSKQDENERIKIRFTKASGEFSRDIPDGRGSGSS